MWKLYQLLASCVLQLDCLCIHFIPRLDSIASPKASYLDAVFMIKKKNNREEFFHFDRFVFIRNGNAKSRTAVLYYCAPQYERFNRLKKKKKRKGIMWHSSRESHEVRMKSKLYKRGACAVNKRDSLIHAIP